MGAGSAAGVDVSTSFNSDCRKLDPELSGPALDPGRPGADALVEAVTAAVGTLLRAADDDSPLLAEPGSAVAVARRVQGRLRARSGSGWGSLGDPDGERRFLLLAGVATSLAFSKAFQARSSSCDSGAGASGRTRAGAKRAAACCRNLAALPCRSAARTRA